MLGEGRGSRKRRDKKINYTLSREKHKMGNFRGSLEHGLHSCCCWDCCRPTREASLQEHWGQMESGRSEWGEDWGQTEGTENRRDRHYPHRRVGSEGKYWEGETSWQIWREWTHVNILRVAGILQWMRELQRHNNKTAWVCWKVESAMFQHSGHSAVKSNMAKGDVLEDKNPSKWKKQRLLP